jgi:hypothetical protein
MYSLYLIINFFYLFQLKKCGDSSFTENVELLKSICLPSNEKRKTNYEYNNNNCAANKIEKESNTLIECTQSGADNKTNNKNFINSEQKIEEIVPTTGYSSSSVSYFESFLELEENKNNLLTYDKVNYGKIIFI